MIKKLCLLLFLLCPAALFAQQLNPNPVPDQVLKQDCNGREFIRVQVLPSLKISKEAFEDTLTKELKSRNFRFKDNEIIYKFLVTSRSQIYHFVIDSGNMTKEDKLRDALEQLADLWVPAKQNGYIVCAFVRLKITVADGKIHTSVFQ